jgi:hypothetical protein
MIIFSSWSQLVFGYVCPLLQFLFLNSFFSGHDNDWIDRDFNVPFSGTPFLNSVPCPITTNRTTVNPPQSVHALFHNKSVTTAHFFKQSSFHSYQWLFQLKEMVGTSQKQSHTFFECIEHHCPKTHI